MSRFSIAGAALAVMCQVAAASAQHDDSPVYNRQGELSPNTQAPSKDAMVRTIENGAPEALFATLEYGERVVCPRCVPLLQNKLLDSNSARAREISAWWLRRQPYASGAVLVWLRDVLATEGDPVRRGRAAEALGEFMDTSSLEALAKVALDDDSAQVRLSAVQALVRLNMEAAGGVIAEALSDHNTDVRLAALSSVLRLNFFADEAALMPLLADDSAEVRARTARLVGELRIVDAGEVLVAMLQEDSAVAARQAAAWALGRLGTAAASKALSKARESESNPRVLDAILVAERM